MKTVLVLAAAMTLAATPAFAQCNGKSKASYQTASHTQSSAQPNIVETAQSAGFNTLLAAASAAGLAETLAGDGPFTVFAPTDEAFAALGQDTINSLLLPENRHQLRDILKYHVISGEVEAADLIGKSLTANTLTGPVIIDGRDGVVVNSSKVIQADVRTSNGIIHVIDRVLLPPVA